MNVVEFKEQTVVYAKDQREYLPLPAYVVKDDPKGKVICCWKMNVRDRFVALFTGRIWHEVLTFDGPLQPQRLSTTKPIMEKP